MEVFARTDKAFPGALKDRARRGAPFGIWMNAEIVSRGRTI